MMVYLGLFASVGEHEIEENNTRARERHTRRLLVVSAVRPHADRAVGAGGGALAGKAVRP